MGPGGHPGLSGCFRHQDDGRVAAPPGDRLGSRRRTEEPRSMPLPGASTTLSRPTFRSELTAPRLSATTYNFDPVSVVQDSDVFGHEKPVHSGISFAEPVDSGLGGIYQDEYTIGVERLLDPTFSIALKGTYRTLGRAIEDRCDLDAQDRDGLQLLRDHEPGLERHDRAGRPSRLRRARRPSRAPAPKPSRRFRPLAASIVESRSSPGNPSARSSGFRPPMSIRPCAATTTAR